MKYEPTIYDDYFIPSHKLRVIDIENDFSKTDNYYLKNDNGFIIVYNIGS